MSRKTVILVTLLALHPALAEPGEASDVPPGFSEVVILATNSIHLSDGVEIRSGDVVANDEVHGPTLDAHVELSIGREVTTPGGFEIQGDSIKIGRESWIAGDISYNELTNDGTLTGTATATLGLPVFPYLPPFQTGAPGGSDVGVGKNDTLVLPPGDYGELDVGMGGTVIFSGGLYSFFSISTDKEAALLFEERSQVRVAKRLLTNKDAIIGPAPSSAIDASEIIFYVAGTNVSDGNPESAAAVILERDNLVLANFYVPGGKLHFKQSVDATGAFVARDVLAEKEARFALDSFFNEPPEAADDSAVVDEGGTVSVLDSSASSVLANDTDPNDDHLTVTTTPVAPPDHGVLTLGADGTFSYVHDGSETTSDRFVYEACDDGTPVLCDTATVSVTITAVNDPPIVADDAATTDEDVAVVIGVLTNDSDVDGQLVPASVTVLSPAAQGATAVSPTTGEITYTPDPDTHGSDSFSYRVCDDGTPLPARCGTATVSVTIRAAVNNPPVNNPPRPHHTVAMTNGSTPVLITLSASDIDGDPLTFSIVTEAAPAAGTLSDLSQVSPASATVIYTPSGPDDLEDVFFFEVCDDATPAACAVGRVRINASLAANDRPNAAVDHIAVPRGGTVTVLDSGAASLLANDSDANGDNLTVTNSPVVAPRNGSLVLSSGGTFSYTHDASVSFTDDFVYEICDDGTPVLCTTAPVFIVVRPTDTIEVTITRQGTGSGRVVSEPAGIDCGSICVADFTAFGRIALSATADSGSVFAGWSGNGDCADATLGGDADKSCIATFEPAPPPLPTFTLTIVKLGEGNGTISSNPRGMTCSGDCSVGFEVGSTIFLLARPADDDSVFQGYGGDADCSDGAITLDADTECTATFAKAN